MHSKTVKNILSRLVDEKTQKETKVLQGDIIAFDLVNHCLSFERPEINRRGFRLKFYNDDKLYFPLIKSKEDFLAIAMLVSAACGFDIRRKIRHGDKFVRYEFVS